MVRRPRGFSLLELLVAIAIIAILVGFVLNGVQAARLAADKLKCANHLKQIALGLHLYHDSHHRFPAGSSGPASNRAMSWHTRLLPYLDRQSQWDRAVRDYAQNQWFSQPPQHPGLSQIIPLFACPLDDRTFVPQPYLNLTVALTSYLGVAGTNYRANDGTLY